MLSSPLQRTNKMPPRGGDHTNVRRRRRYWHAQELSTLVAKFCMTFGRNCGEISLSQMMMVSK